ncbi:MAG: nicotinamide mononucleotide deamidase-related protein [Candidatus Bathyarchaeia archaeon]
MGADMEIICVGNELLIGKTLNTNAQWLAKGATALGVNVKRITTIGDDVQEIANALQDALKRKPKFIITTGGLGPTFDDKTLEGVAKALNRKLEVNEKALKMVREKYEALASAGKIDAPEMTPHRVKMAKLPEGAEPLPNPAGTAPGVLIKIDETYLVALPGVPSEMEAIFDESLISLIRREAGDATFYETSIYADGVFESSLAPLIELAMKENPYVYVKSHPRGAEKHPHIEIHLSTTAKNSKEAKDRLGKAIVQLSKLIKDKGGKVKFKLR